MENFDFNYLSKRIKINKRKIYEEINDADLIDLPPEKIDKIKNNKEEKLIQLFDDSDSLEEILPELNKKIKEEEEKSISLSNQSIMVINEEGSSIKKKRSKKDRNISFVNINIPNYKKKFFTEKENKPKEEINNKKTYISRKNILLYDPKIIEEEDLKEEEDNNSADDNPKSKINTKYQSKRFLFEENLDISHHSSKTLMTSKSQDFKKEKKSRLLDEIKNLAKTINVFLFDTDEYIKINIYPSNTVKEIKTKIIHELKAKKYNLSSTSTDAYDLRPIDEEGDSPDMDFPPLRDYIRVAGLKPQALAFLKNPDFTSKTTREKSFDMSSFLYQKKQNLMFGSFKARNSRFSVVPEEDDEDGPEKYEVKIYYKDIKEEDVISLSKVFFKGNYEQMPCFIYFSLD
jgi:hypothetical protein